MKISANAADKSHVTIAASKSSKLAKSGKRETEAVVAIPPAGQHCERGESERTMIQT